MFLIAFTANSQNIVTGTMISENDELSWVALYQLTGSKQFFIKSTTLENGKFSIEIPENSPAGMYRLKYKMDNESYVDFIFTNENVNLQFNASNPSQTIEFFDSEENILFTNYITQTDEIRQQLNAIQYSFFKSQTEDEKNTAIKLYEILYFKYVESQKQFEENSNHLLANHFIKASKKYYTQNLFENPQEYLNSEKNHFFDFIDFSDNALINSTFISQHVLDYVFYLNFSDDAEVQNILYKNAINEVFENSIENIQLKKDILTNLLNAFAQNENLNMVDFIQENYYNTLPIAYKSDAEITNLFESLTLAIGRKAPDFSWEEKGIAKNLYDLKNAETFILVFWSTSCSHCIDEIPKLYDFTKNKTNTHVVGIALENDIVEFEKYNNLFEKWSNVLGLGKWENDIAQKYKIISTPTYFILDTHKNIIEKPELLEDVKVYFEN